MKLGGLAGSPEGHTTFQRDLDRLGWRESHDVQQRDVQSSALGEEHQAHIYAGGAQLYWKGSGQRLDQMSSRGPCQP